MTAIALLLIVTQSCATGRPSGTPVAPLTATTREATIAELASRRANFRGMKSLMRVRATHNGQTQSFRAQLSVHDAKRMELIAYSPVGTKAFSMKANGFAITTDPPVPPESFAFLTEEIAPAEWGMLILGIPPRDEPAYQYEAGGLTRAVHGDVEAVFDPPSFPAKHVVVTRGSDRVEIEHLEVVSE
jgi:hypothetical protein